MSPFPTGIFRFFFNVLTSQNNRLRFLTALWGKKSQRDLGKGMLGMLVQCTKDSFPVLIVEALCVLS